MEKKQVWQNLRKRLLNKYVIVLGVFAIVFLFVGEQSIINQIARKRQIRLTQREIEQTLQQSREAESLLRSLEHPDSLEKFAREQYNMHTDNEVVYIVE
jgi:cell division protein FtsB